MIKRFSILTPLLLLSLLVANQVVAEVIDGEELRDPTRPFRSFGSQTADDDSVFLDRFVSVFAGSFEVSFVRAGSSAPMAVVNQQRVTIGDRVGGAEVISIDRSGVTLLVNDEERHISLFGTSVKSPAVTP